MKGFKEWKAGKKILFFSVIVLVLATMTLMFSLPSLGKGEIREEEEPYSRNRVSLSLSDEAELSVETAGSISGTVTSAAQPEGVEGVEVYLYAADDSSNWIDMASTGQNGCYQFNDVSPSEYKVCFSPISGMSYLEEWFENKYDFDTADVITLDPGKNETGVNALLDIGTISGRVTGDMDPDGVKYIPIIAYRNYSGSYAWAGDAFTDQDGNYVLSGLRTGTYKIFFDPADPPKDGYDDQYYYHLKKYATQWYNGKPDVNTADTVDVALGVAPDNIDAYLRTGNITGRITSPEEPLGVKSVDVYAYDINRNLVAGAVTGPDGSYRVLGLSTGDYRVYAYPWYPNSADGRTYAYEWHEDKGTFETAEPVQVTNGQETPNIDFSLESGSISGTVTGAGGGGALQGVDVYVHDLDFNLVGMAKTDGDGIYTVRGVRPGTYAVYFDPTYIREEKGQDYCGEYYDNKDSFFDATLVPVASDVTGINAELEAGSYIEGKVTSDGVNGIGGIYVHAYHADDPTYWVGFAETDPDGTYSISGLAPGDYRVSLNHSSGQNYLDEWYDNKADFYSADIISLNRGGGASGKDAVLDAGGSISGTVTGSDTKAGLEGVQVRVLDGGYNFLGGTLTASDGTYSVGGLPTGQHFVEFFPGEELNYQGEFYDDQPTFDEANPVPVTAGSNTSGIDAELQRYGSISGRVTSADYPGGMEGISVNLYTSKGWWGWAGSSVTDSSGNYTIDHLPGGDYTVMFSAGNFNYKNGKDYADEWYDDHASSWEADFVTVLWGSDKTGINAQLEKRGKITGRVTSDSNPQGVQDAWVEVEDLSGNGVAWGRTASDGYYSVSVKPGTYKANFYHWPEGLKYYDDKNSFDTADLVTVNEGQTRSGIHCQFTAAPPGGLGSISGQITSDSQPEGVDLSHVYIYRSDDPNPCYVKDGYTDENGNYLVDNLQPGSYKVLFGADLGMCTAFKWYDDRGSYESATEVVVKAGEETSCINALFHDSQLSIQGRVTSDDEPDGVFMAEASVHDISGSTPGWGTIYMGHGYTDSNGYY